MEYLFRFLAGGIVVSACAVLGDFLRPKSFAGLFGAAPSVALATLSLTIWKDGNSYAALEARSMIVGAVAFFLYACACAYLLMKTKLPAIAVTTSMLSIWLIFAVGVWLIVLR